MMMMNVYDDDVYDEYQMILMDHYLFGFVYELNRMLN